MDKLIPQDEKKNAIIFTGCKYRKFYIKIKMNSSKKYLKNI